MVTKTSDWDAVKRLHDLLSAEFGMPENKRPLLNHLKNNHAETYGSIISECKTHGPGFRASINNFAADQAKVPPPERLSAARKALGVVEEIAGRQSRKIAWGLGMAGVVAAVGAFFINRMGKEEKEAETPAHVEKPQSWQKKWAGILTYLGIHTGYCTATDFLNPPINTLTNNWLRWLIPGCGHDHSGGAHHHHVHGPACDHAAPTGSRWERTKKAFVNSFSKERLISYCKGEFIGDFGAIPLTMLEQKLFPNFVRGLRTACEPVVGPLFKWGVERDSKSWAAKHHLALDAPQVKEREKKLYNYEMEHFPEAVLWTGNALALNTAYQMHVDKARIPFANKLLLHSTSVLSGVLVTAGVVVAARALMPDRMHRFEEWMTKNVTLPPMMAVGKAMGIDKETLENAVSEHNEHAGGEWTARVRQEEALAEKKRAVGE